MWRILDRLSIAFLGTATLCLGGVIVIIIAYAVHIFTMQYENIESTTLVQLFSDTPFLFLGTTGALVGAITGKAGITALVAVGHTLVDAAEWCLKRSRRSK